MLSNTVKSLIVAAATIDFQYFLGSILLSKFKKVTKCAATNKGRLLLATLRYSRYLPCSYELIEILNFLIWNVVIGMTSLFQSFKRHRKEVWRQDVSTHVILHHHFRPKVGREKRIRCRNLRHERALLLRQCCTMLKTSQITYKASYQFGSCLFFASISCYLTFEGINSIDSGKCKSSLFFIWYNFEFSSFLLYSRWDW